MHDGHPDAVKRNEYYDAMFCKVCDSWLEDRCDDPRCNFCPQRPEKPSESNYK
jgi:hypothetical protein